MNFEFIPISKNINVSAFKCEESSLNNFLCKSALIDHNRGLSATTVAVKKGDKLKKAVG